MTNEQFDKVISEKETKIVILSTSWCGPCVVLGKTVDKIKKEYPDLGDKIIKIDIDEDPTLAERFSVMSVPTILYVKDGSVEQKKGVQSESDLLKFFP